jgi:hypothetical protein
VIERYQGVGKSWGEPHSCASAAELQRRRDELDRWQRDLDPTAEGRPRRAAYSGLKHSGRLSEVAREGASWDLRLAWAWVGSHHLVRRQVGSRGKVSLYNRPDFVGWMRSGRTIWIGFDPERGEWMLQDEGGHEIRRQVASELSAERILALEVTQRRAVAMWQNLMSGPGRQNLPSGDPQRAPAFGRESPGYTGLCPDHPVGPGSVRARMVHPIPKAPILFPTHSCLRWEGSECLHLGTRPEGRSPSRPMDRRPFARAG